MYKGIKHTNYGDIILGSDDLSNNFLNKDESFMWDSHLKPFYDKYLNQDSVVIDVGANIGTHTIFLGQTCKKVYAFEPQKYIYYQLCGNIFINNLLNVDAYNLACYEETCYMDLTLDRPNYLDSHYSASLGFSKTNNENGVRAIKLDEFINEKIDLIKIDAQGSDLQVMRGGVELIKKYKPIILFELEDQYLLDSHHSSREDYFKFLSNINYNYTNINGADFVALAKN